ncbi:MAG: hypothetical protein NTX96_03365 [Candidatus Zambryskibacteria bacterium]|nr:hypothetical protein [Candidatus Zambryskibacteria bacterium]
MKTPNLKKSKSLVILKKEVEETLKNTIKINKQNQKLLALWAADCAEHVLPYFEKEYPKDDRPRKAIEVGRAWVRSGKPMVMKEIRTAALDAHAAARNAPDNSAARAAARSAGQAVATAHVVGHALGAAIYALKVAEAENIADEREWQYQCLLKNLRLIN